jgi:hypothetical protein
MCILRKAKEIFSKQTGFFQYYYAVYMRNYYPYKLIGEKQSESTNGTIIIFNKTGSIASSEISIKKLLSDLALISNFNPEDAYKIGFIALEQFICEVPLEERFCKFNEIKKIMLNSTGCINQNINLSNFIFNDNDEKPSINNSKITQHKNTYPYRLVGEKNNKNTSETTIIYTILGKRDGYTKSLKNLILHKEIIGKFHPTEAVKFGFIYMGDILFGSSSQ